MRARITKDLSFEDITVCRSQMGNYHIRVNKDIEVGAMRRKEGELFCNRIRHSIKPFGSMRDFNESPCVNCKKVLEDLMRNAEEEAEVRKYLKHVNTSKSGKATNEELMQMWENNLRGQKKSEGTIRKYINVAELFAKFINKPFIEAWFVDIESFIYRGDNEPATQSVHKYAINHFYGYLESHGWVDKNPLNGKLGAIKVGNREKLVVNVISPSEINDIARYLKRYNNTRDLILLSMMLTTGPRKSEILNLKVKDIIDRYDGKWVRYYGKRRKEREVPLGEDMFTMIADYIRKKGLRPDDYIFMNAYRERLNTYYPNKLLNEISEKTGMRHIHPHLFRHTYITNLLESGVEAIVVKELVGHESLATTEGYSHIRPAAKQDVIRQHAPKPIEWKQGDDDDGVEVEMPEMRIYPEQDAAMRDMRINDGDQG